MRDSRLSQATSLGDDMRCLLVDIVDERPLDGNLRDFNHLDAARQLINAAIIHIQQAQEKTA